MIITAPKKKKIQKLRGSLRLTKQVDYALFFLVTLAKNKSLEITSIKKIANENNLSFSFLQKVARTLQQGNLIKAGRGKYGGYALLKNPNTITLKEILEILEGPIAITPCFCDIPSICSQKDFCKIRNGLKKINEEIKKTFLSKTLKHFI